MGTPSEPAPSGTRTQPETRRRGIFEMGSGLFLLFSIFYFLFSHVASAATFRLYFRTEDSVGTGDEFTTRMLLDSAQPVNTYSVIATYNPSSLAFIAADNSHSIIDISRGEPAVSQSGNIEFKGGSLKPFSGTGGELITLHFRALHAGKAQLGFGKSSLYLSNGKGTKVIPDMLAFQLVVSDKPVAAAQPVSDTASPQITFLSFAPDPFNASQKFLTFSATDSGSGVKKALYRYRDWFFSSDEAQAANPIALPRAAWSVDLEVYDNGGNVAAKTIYDWAAFFEGPFLLVLCIIVAMLAVQKLLHRR